MGTVALSGTVAFVRHTVGQRSVMGVPRCVGCLIRQACKNRPHVFCLPNQRMKALQRATYPLGGEDPRKGPLVKLRLAIGTNKAMLRRRTPSRQWAITIISPESP